MFCPNCMSPHVEAVTAESPDEPLMHCTECEYTAPKSEFVPENYR